jgi:hypothetical protein
VINNCIAICAVVITLYKAIQRVCLYDVLAMQMCVEGTCQEEKEPSHHHVAYRTSLPHKRPHLIISLGSYLTLPASSLTTSEPATSIL